MSPAARTFACSGCRGKRRGCGSCRPQRGSPCSRAGWAGLPAGRVLADEAIDLGVDIPDGAEPTTRASRRPPVRRAACARCRGAQDSDRQCSLHAAAGAKVQYRFDLRRRLLAIATRRGTLGGEPVADPLLRRRGRGRQCGPCGPAPPRCAAPVSRHIRALEDEIGRRSSRARREG